MVAGDSPWGNRVEITDRDGWRKEFPLEKALLYVGSDARNDVVLDPQRGGGVMSRHVQLIALPPGGRGGAGYRAINLSDQDVVLGEVVPSTPRPGYSGEAVPSTPRPGYSGEVAEHVLAPRAAVEIGDGDVLHVGEFYLVFRLGVAARGGPSGLGSGSAARAAAPVVAPPAAFERRELEPVSAPGVQGSAPGVQGYVARPTPRMPSTPTEQGQGVLGVGVEDHSAHISVRLSLPRTRVEPEFPLEGSVILRNLGSEQAPSEARAVQFRLEVEGLPRDWYQIGAGPILFPNVEKAVPLRVQHPRGPGLAAGRHEIQIRVSAPDAYPGEEVCVRHDIEIVPYYHHTLALTVLD